MEILRLFVANPEWAAAAVFGAILSVPLQRSVTTFPQRVWACCLSLCLAYFLTFPVMKYFALPELYTGGVALLVALFGVSIMATLMRAVLGLDLLAWLSSKFGGGA